VQHIYLPPAYARIPETPSAYRKCVDSVVIDISAGNVSASEYDNNKQQQQPFNGLFSRTTWVSWYQKGKTNLDFTAARDSEWQWHQLGICKSAPRSRQITTPVPHHSVFYRPDALPAAQPTASKH